MSDKLSRRRFLRSAGAVAGAGLLTAACQPAPAAPAPAAAAQPEAAKAAPASASNNPQCGDLSGKEFVWCNNMKNYALFMDTDMHGYEAIAKELGVKTAYVGPEKNDMPAFVAAIEQTAARKPAGVLVTGWDATALIQPINTLVDAGIPTVTVDADVPDSKRLTYIGTDWNDIGTNQAKAMLKALNGRKGKIGCIMLLTGDNMQRAYAGFKNVMAGTGNEVLDAFESKGDLSQTTQISTDLMRGHPDLVGLAGFDGSSAGVGMAIREEGKKDKVVGTGNNTSAEQLEVLKDGSLVALSGQKRELFTYYGVKALVEHLLNTVKMTDDDKAAGLTTIPAYYNTGTFMVTKDNIQYWLKS